MFWLGWSVLHSINHYVLCTLVLTYLQGTMLEKFLTVPQDEFNRYLRDAPKFTEEEIDTRREAYRYSKVQILFFILK
jgi:hypothetical protein